MAQAELGSFIDTAGVPRPIQAVAMVQPNGDEVERDEDGYTPWEAAVILLLTDIRTNTSDIASNTAP